MILHKTNGDKKLHLFRSAIVALIIVISLFVFLSFGYAKAESINEDFYFHNQWYANQSFLNYTDTLSLIQSQNIAENKQEYLTNPIVIAVIDTGIDYNHPVFENIIFENKAELNGIEGVDDDDNGFIDDIRGWNFVDGNNNAKDTCIKNDSHGTHVAGIIAQQIIDYNLTDYIKLLPIKAGNDSLNTTGAEFTSNHTISAIDYAIESGVKVINMSLGAYEESSWGHSTGWGRGSSVEDAINDANANDILVFAAAGNDGKYAIGSKSTFYPAGFNNVYGIMAYDETNSLAIFSNGSSNRGSCYDFIAPGKNIYSTMRNGRYGVKNGTSMACPMVTAMASIITLKYDGDISIVREVLKNHETTTLGETTYRKASLKNMLNYIPVEQIQIECTSDNLNQKINEISKIECKADLYVRYDDQTEATLQPDSSIIYDSVKWYIIKDGQQIDTRIGRYLSYQPTEAGIYSIYTTTNNSITMSNNIEFEINYLGLSEVDNTQKEFVDKLYLGESYNFYINGYEYINPIEMPIFYWYVNGNLITSTQDYLYNFEPTETGKYEIICKIADSNEILAKYNVTVKNDNRKVTKIILYSVALLIVMVVYLLALITIVKEIKIKKPNIKNKQKNQNN